MKKFLVVFPANIPEQDLIVRRIKTVGPWARITPSSWCVKKDNISTSWLRDFLSAGLNGENLFVIDISDSSWASYKLPRDVANWLKND